MIERVQEESTVVAFLNKKYPPDARVTSLIASMNSRCPQMHLKALVTAAVLKTLTVGNTRGKPNRPLDASHAPAFVKGGLAKR